MKGPSIVYTCVGMCLSIINLALSCVPVEMERGRKKKKLLIDSSRTDRRVGVVCAIHIVVQQGEPLGRCECDCAR
jgi:hypothetical protein